jgi:hypothetical protein
MILFSPIHSKNERWNGKAISGQAIVVFYRGKQSEHFGVSHG